MAQKKVYLAPALTVVQVRAEKGYADSGHLTESIDIFFLDHSTERETETFTTHDSWTQNNQDGFWS